jgi:hypothetical protein
MPDVFESWFLLVSDRKIFNKVPAKFHVSAEFLTEK